MSSPESKPLIILLHGAWHSATCWQELSVLLAKKGLDCLTPDLPGHGTNRHDINKINLNIYSRYISQLIDNYNYIVLIAHSMAGILASRLAEEHSNKVKHLIYLSAYLPGNEQSLFDLMQIQRQQHGAAPIESAIEFSPDKRQCSLNRQDIIPLFYNCCSLQQKQAGLSQIQAQASLPLAAKVHLSQNGFGTIPKSYIRCLQDRVIPQSQFQWMLEAQPCDQIYTLDTDHSPFWSEPVKLAELLHDIVDKPHHY